MSTAFGRRTGTDDTDATSDTDTFRDELFGICSGHGFRTAKTAGSTVALMVNILDASICLTLAVALL